MRHGKTINHLGRTAPHRRALLANMAISLITHKRITTTVAKAKALRKYAEPLLTKAKTDSTHSRRVVFSYLQNKDAVTELFREVSGKIAERNGGYTRIIKIGARPGDNSEMAIIELVDYNATYVKEGAKAAITKKRTRRSSAPAKAADTKATKTEAPKAEEASSSEEAQQPEGGES